MVQPLDRIAALEQRLGGFGQCNEIRRVIRPYLLSFFACFQLFQGIPVILVGDFNSDAATNGTAYLMITGGGFADIWSNEPPTNPGLTWPLSGEIPNTIMTPTERLDLVFTRGRITLTDADIVGEDPVLDLTPSGFRPSDHAGVVGSVVLQP